MTLHVVLTVGTANTLDISGDVPFEQVIELAAMWLATVDPSSAEAAQHVIDAMTARIRKQDQSIRAATAADSPD